MKIKRFILLSFLLATTGVANLEAARGFSASSEHTSPKFYLMRKGQTMEVFTVINGDHLQHSYKTSWPSFVKNILNQAKKQAKLLRHEQLELSIYRSHRFDDSECWARAKIHPEGRNIELWINPPRSKDEPPWQNAIGMTPPMFFHNTAID